MSAPGGGFDEGARGDGVNPPPAGGREPHQPDWKPPWDPPAADYPLPPYSPLGYPAEYPPSLPPPPGYGQPPGYGGPPYVPGPPQFGGPPAGYGPLPYPGGYYPAPEYPGDYGHPYGPQNGAQPGMNGLAIASLISSFVGLLCCIGSIVAIVLGAIALDQIKRTRQDGYALAVAGIVIGVATLIVGLVIAIFAMHSR